MTLHFCIKSTIKIVVVVTANHYCFKVFMQVCITRNMYSSYKQRIAFKVDQLIAGIATSKRRQQYVYSSISMRKQQVHSGISLNVLVVIWVNSVFSLTVGFVDTRLSDDLKRVNFWRLGSSSTEKCACNYLFRYLFAWLAVLEAVNN